DVPSGVEERQKQTEEKLVECLLTVSQISRLLYSVESPVTHDDICLADPDQCHNAHESLEDRKCISREDKVSLADLGDDDKRCLAASFQNQEDQENTLSTLQHLAESSEGNENNKRTLNVPNIGTVETSTSNYGHETMPREDTSDLSVSTMNTGEIQSFFNIASLFFIEIIDLPCLNKNKVQSTILADRLFKDIQSAKTVDARETLRHVMDSIALFGHANWKLNMKRREIIKPDLNPSYTRLCKEEIKPTTKLFGDDLSKHLKEMSELKRAGQQMQKLTTGSAHTYTVKASSLKNQRSKPTTKQSFQCLPAPPFFWTWPGINSDQGKQQQPKELSQDTIEDQSFDACHRNIAHTVCLFTNLGFTIHPVKSVLQPQQKIDFLGFVLDSSTMTVTLTDAKAMKVRSACQNLLLQKTATIRSVAQVIGFLVSSFPAVEFAEMHYRHLELDKICALRANKGNFDSTMTLSAQSKTELTWWIDNVLTASKPIRHGNPDLTLTTDASKFGREAVCVETSTGGFWSLEEQRYHIKFLELKAVLLGLKSLCGAFSEKHILVQTDNTTAVAYINAMGEDRAGSINRNPHCANVDNSTLVYTPFAPSDRPPLNTSSDRQSSLPAPQQCNSSSQQTVAINGLQSIRESFQQRDISSKAISIILQSWSTAQRGQSLHMLDIQFMKEGDSFFEFALPEHIKQSRLGYKVPSVLLQAFPADQSLCVFTHLKEYLQRTKCLRGTETKLLISHAKPHHRASRDTISRWIRSVMTEAGIDVTTFKPHSTRAAAASKTKNVSVPVKEILDTAGWSSERTFDRFYDKPFQKAGGFATSVLTVD
ncbi:hypothetical protein AWC38_SpisGene4801, partial [Stylophora pistillata]